MKWLMSPFLRLSVKVVASCWTFHTNECSSAPWSRVSKFPCHELWSQIQRIMEQLVVSLEDIVDMEQLGDAEVVHVLHS